MDELSREEFVEIVHEIMNYGPPLVGDDILKSEIAIDRLFDLLDSDGSGELDLKEVKAGVV